MKEINGLGHIALKVRDMDKSMAFYTGVLGLPEMLRLHHPDGSLFLIYLRVNDINYIELFPEGMTDGIPGLTATGTHHFCLTVTQMETVVDRVRANGGSFAKWGQRDGVSVLEPHTEPSIGNGLDGNRQCWLLDPDGNRIELMEMADDCLQFQALRRLAAAS